VIALYTDSDVVGGAERSLLTLIEAYRGDADLVLVSPETAVLDEAARRGTGCGVVRVPLGSAGQAGFSSLRRALRDLRPDLLHVNLPNPFAARSVLLAAYSLGIRTTTTEHLVMPSRRRRGRLLKRLYSMPLVAQIAVGRASAEFLTSHYRLRRSTVHAIHNGVAQDEVRPLAYGHRPVVGSAARFEDQKQLDVLVRAMADVPHAHLVLVGDGSQRDQLVALATSVGILERVTFTGWVDDARPYIAGFDVFVLPSRNEAFPLTIVEAMIAGTPVIATDVGSVREAVHDGTTGVLVESGDVAGLTNAIERLLDDASTRDRLTAAAGELARAEFTATAMADRYEALWRSVLAVPRRRLRAR
jgi:glycosyltransferase involved in cell wall biosynthesis